MKRKILLVLFILFILSLLSSCSTRELNSFGLVTALGIDKDKAGYMLTYQVLNPKAIASKKSVNESPFFIYEEKGNNLDEINKRSTTQASRKMYASHVRAVVIGEDLARDGLKEILDYLFRNNEYRTDYYFFIAKGTTANQLLSTATTIESVSGIKLYDSINNSHKIWAPTNSLKIVELVNDINSKGKHPVLAGVSFEEQTNDIDSIDRLKNSDPVKLKIIALGAFHDDKLVGWLDETESIAYTNIVGKAKASAVYVDYDENTNVSLHIISKKAKINASLSDGKPVISVNLSSEMIITAEKGEVDFSDQKNLDKLNSKASEKTVDFYEKILDKAQHELKTDIFGFGESIHRAYPKVWKELKDKWDDEFTRLEVSFKVDTKITDLGENLKPIINKEE